MFNLQGSEIIVILLLALVVLGPEKLPGAIRRFTKTYAELKKMGNSFQDEVKSAFDEPMREVRQTADLIKQQVDVDALEADVDAQAEPGTTTASETGDELGGASTPESAGPSSTALLAAPDPDDLPAAMPPPVAGTKRPGPNATPAPPNVPAPPPPFSGSNGAVPAKEASQAESRTQEEESPS